LLDKERFGEKVELDQVIQNIRLSTRKTVSKGCTEAEAMAAATKVG